MRGSGSIPPIAARGARRLDPHAPARAGGPPRGHACRPRPRSVSPSDARDDRAPPPCLGYAALPGRPVLVSRAPWIAPPYNLSPIGHPPIDRRRLHDHTRREGTCWRCHSAHLGGVSEPSSRNLVRSERAPTSTRCPATFAVRSPTFSPGRGLPRDRATSPADRSPPHSSFVRSITMSARRAPPSRANGSTSGAHEGRPVRSSTPAPLHETRSVGARPPQPSMGSTTPMTCSMEGAIAVPVPG